MEHPDEQYSAGSMLLKHVLKGFIILSMHKFSLKGHLRRRRVSI